jgi:hypothetical protein
MIAESIPWSVIAVKLVEPTPQPAFSQIEKELQEEIAPRILSAERGAICERMKKDFTIINSFLNLENANHLDAFSNNQFSMAL